MRKGQFFGRGIRLAWAACVMTAALAGCGVKSEFIEPYRMGKYDEAAAQATQIADHAEARDAVFYRLEQGAVLRTAGRIEDSLRAFDQADEVIRQYDTEADVKLSQETAAAFTNLSTLEYRGYCYDRIMLNTYKAIDSMELGRLDAARVELNRAYERQQEAVDRYAKKIEADQALRKEAAEGKQPSEASSTPPADKSYDVSRAEQDPKLQESTKPAYEGLDDLAAYELYVNPFAEYMRGVYYMGAAQDASDRETAVASFRRVAGMVKDNPFVMQDLEAAEAAANGKPVGPVTYVIFESGLAPERGAIRIDVPIFLGSLAFRKDLQVDYVGASIPKLNRGPSGPEYLEIQAAGNTLRTTLLSDMDHVIAREFKNELPMVITKTLIATATKAAAAYGINQATSGNQWANIAARIGTTVYQVWQNQADLRTWRTLPKQIHIARMPTPPDRQLTLSAPGGAAPAVVALGDGEVNVVYVKAVLVNQPLVVRQFKLK